MTENILAFIDAPDPDNFALLIGAYRLFPHARIFPVLTGRPTNLEPTTDTPLWDYDLQASRMTQLTAAARIKNFLREYGITDVTVYDGGIAPRTPVPHDRHFEDHFRFFDVNPLAAQRHSQLTGIEQLIGEVLRMDRCAAVVGGPMTGLAQMLTRAPATGDKISEVHAMFATWGTVELMQFGDTPRGPTQFNVVCDPAAAHLVLSDPRFPITLLPTEVTRARDVGFATPDELRAASPRGRGPTALHRLYDAWYEAVVRPRQAVDANEMLFVHDLAAILSLHPTFRERLYDIVPIDVGHIPHLGHEAASWGQLPMYEAGYDRPVSAQHNRFAATTLKPGARQAYLDALQCALAQQ